MIDINFLEIGAKIHRPTPPELIALVIILVAIVVLFKL